MIDPHNAETQRLSQRNATAVGAAESAPPHSHWGSQDLKALEGYVDIMLPTPKFVKARTSRKGMEISLPWALDGSTLCEALSRYVLPNAFGCSLKAAVGGTPCRIHNVKIEASQDPCQGLRVEGSLEFEHPQQILPLIWNKEEKQVASTLVLDPKNHVPPDEDTGEPAVAKDTNKPQWEQTFRDIRFDRQKGFWRKQWTGDDRWKVVGFKKLFLSLEWCSPAAKESSHELPEGGEVPEGGHKFYFHLAAYRNIEDTDPMSTQVVTGQMVSAFVLALLDRIGHVASMAVRDEQWAQDYKKETLSALYKTKTLSAPALLARLPAGLRGPAAHLSARAWRRGYIGPADEIQVGDMALSALIRTLNTRFAFKKNILVSQLSIHCLADLLPTERRTQAESEAALADFVQGLKTDFFTTLAQELMTEKKNAYATKIADMASAMPANRCDKKQAVEIVLRQYKGGPPPESTVLVYRPQSRPPSSTSHVPSSSQSVSPGWGWRQSVQGAGSALLEAHRGLKNMLGWRA